MDIRHFLSGIFLFNSFTEKEIDLIEPFLFLKNVQKGEQIFLEGAEATAFFIVVSGKVKIYKLSPDGKEHTLHIQVPGDLVAEAAIFDSMVYPASCVAIENSTLIRVPKEGLNKLIKKHPEVALKMMSGYSRRLRQFVAKIEELSLKDIKTRLADYLLKNSTLENGITLCRLTYSKKELASVLGTIPETLSRALAFLKQKNLIIEENNTIIIPDPEKLRTFSLLT
ncbi:MAG: Crp/Fnr family transcriptional regulator [Nitrospirae bacterium]|nr:Crp/Fnr family transcriptional regulator [Nitrospirota bacterium]